MISLSFIHKYLPSAYNNTHTVTTEFEEEVPVVILEKNRTVTYTRKRPPTQAEVRKDVQELHKEVLSMEKEKIAMEKENLI